MLNSDWLKTKKGPAAEIVAPKSVKEAMYLVRSGQVIDDQYLNKIVSQQIDKNFSSNIDKETFESLKTKFGTKVICKSMCEFYRS